LNVLGELSEDVEPVQAGGRYGRGCESSRHGAAQYPDGAPLMESAVRHCHRLQRIAGVVDGLIRV
jgi:hypothetical protein